MNTSNRAEVGHQVSSTRNIVKVFLASPGDLTDERKAAKGVVDEFNVTWADKLGYQVQLVGWEDTVSIWGRPQESINRDLEKCELFIGMMWKKWGTPPSKSGPHTSGFEEEFRLTFERRASTGKPDMSLFFKAIPDDMLQDPGAELRKVLDFRAEIIADKSILFQSFSNIRELEQLVRRKISAYVQALYNDDEKVDSDASIKGNLSAASHSVSEQKAVGRLLWKQESDFLADLIERDDQSFTVPEEVARLRLISHGLAHSNNDMDPIGPHDANIIFAARRALTLSGREASSLLDAGLSRIEQQNAPLWHWLFSLPASDIEERLVVESLAGRTDNIKSGALRVMMLGNFTIDCLSWNARDRIIDSWLSKDTAAAVKKAALSYLSHMGREEDIPQLRREYDKGDHSTVRSAAEAILCISMRQGKSTAVEALLDLQFDVASEFILASVTDALSIATEDQLVQAAAYRTSNVRMAALNELVNRKSTRIELYEHLLDDSSSDVRYSALTALEQTGRVFALAEAKAIIIKPKSNAFSLGWSGADSAAEDHWKTYRSNAYSKLSVSELLDAYEADGPLEHQAYIALAKKYKGGVPFDIRKDLEDSFAVRTESMLEAFENKYGGLASDLVGRTRQLSEYTRKGFFRSALDVLCEFGEPQDLALVRRAVDGKFADAGQAEIDFLKRFGDWSDIPRVAAIADRQTSFLVSMSGVRVRTLKAAGKTIVRLAGNRIEEMLGLLIAPSVLEYVIAELPMTKLRNVSDDTLIPILLNGVDSLRRTASVRVVQSLTKQRLSKLLDAYIGTAGMRYYNTIFWLDLGVSAHSVEQRGRIAGSALANAT
ncbi:DUF4062 domain-containing protein [Brevundimonas sp.]|uniref:DUF4062 domain-containing protein n=1 Tax=Brevundimonas sp. TaxID=1871086 RepID=UPI0024871055|nr:DUF4062 domain-containing protein [Brevundimonas sp.]MDI1282646.1 DUF4062 domain-containing protein [Brevundimonas sp.]